MSVIQSENTNLVLDELSKLTDVSLFQKGVQENPELIFNAVKELTSHHQDLGSVTSVLQAAQFDLSARTNELSKATTELESAQQKIKRLEKKVSSSPSGQSQTEISLNKLIEALSRWQSHSVGSFDTHSVAVFNGDKSKFSTWKDGILMKLRSNPHCFPTEKSMMNFIYSKLNEDCQAHLHSWMIDGELTFPSLKSMLDLLEILFDDPNRVQDAKLRLHSNKQRNKPFSTWIAEIRRDAATAGYDKYPGPLRDIIFLNINLELKQALIYEKDIESLDLDNAIARLQDIDNKQRSFASSASKLRYKLPSPQIISSYNTNSSPTTTQGGDAMDLSASKIRAKGPLSEEEKSRRRKMGLCLLFPLHR